MLDAEHNDLLRSFESPVRKTEGWCALGMAVEKSAARPIGRADE